MSTIELQARLLQELGRHTRIAIAVSGGIDSMTLAFIAHRLSPHPAAMVHAVSPAVPPKATERVEAYAAREGWDLTIVDAGEFADPIYRANPVDRCYYCKSHLYNRIHALVQGTVASGANLDDLNDFRPGLTAAAERGIVHPFIASGIDKNDIRAIARWHALKDIVDLPAQPCLASRVETGIRIEPAEMTFIDQVECRMREVLGDSATIRCRITMDGVAIEVGVAELAAAKGQIETIARLMCTSQGRPFAGVRPYRQGSAFLKNEATASGRC
ncbi:MAG: adenine nucleotide alpha hydrolase [Proteobacteria bacterium]|nr:MAG: adenine nucleotide alpha hydrolase [Pseudomonadota bacterium]QKK10639.1 MAG: adenine nucleotide alpha hydrolase [Pseudomonadota bacterium]